MNKKHLISNNPVFLKTLYFFLLIPHLKTNYLNNILFWDTVFNIGRVISFVFILGYCIFISQKVSKVVLWIILIKLMLLLITIIKDGEIYPCIIDFFSTVSVAMICDVCCEKKEIFYSAALFCFEIFIYINLLTEYIYYPDGMYISQYGRFVARQNYFLGFYNNHTQYFIPALLFAFLYLYYTGKKLRTYSLVLAIYVSAIRVWSGGVMLALSAMVIAYILSKSLRKFFNYFQYWMLHIFFFIFIIIFKVQYLFKWLIDDLLGKWNSMTGRMTLWDAQIEIIVKALWFGHGRQSALFRGYECGIYWGGHAHNMLLEILYQGGLVYLILFVNLVFITGKELYKCTNKKKLRIIETAFCGWCVHCLVEPFWTAFLMCMFVIAYRESIYCQEKQQYKKSESNLE